MTSLGRGGAAQDGDRVPGLFARDVLKPREALLDAGGQWIGERGLLQEGSVVAAGFETEGLELGGDEEGCDVLVAGSGAAAVKLVVGEEVHVRANFAFQGRGERRRLAGCCVE